MIDYRLSNSIHAFAYNSIMNFLSQPLRTIIVYRAIIIPVTMAVGYMNGTNASYCLQLPSNIICTAQRLHHLEI